MSMLYVGTRHFADMNSILYIKRQIFYFMHPVPKCVIARTQNSAQSRSSRTLFRKVFYVPMEVETYTPDIDG